MKRKKENFTMVELFSAINSQVKAEAPIRGYVQ